MVWWASHRDRLPLRLACIAPAPADFISSSNMRPTSGAPPLGCAPGIDVRGDGGYFVDLVAGHGPVGAEQCDVGPLAGLVMCPAIGITTDRDLTDYGARRLRTDAIGALIAEAQAGERTQLTYWAACRVGEMVASGLLDAHDAAAVIRKRRRELACPVRKPNARHGVASEGPEGSPMRDVTAAEIVDLALRAKPELIIHVGNLPATAEALRDLLSASGKLFDRGLPVRIIRPADGTLPSAVPLTKHNVVMETHRLCQPVKIGCGWRARPSNVAGPRRTDVSRHVRRMALAPAGWCQHGTAALSRWEHPRGRRLRCRDRVCGAAEFQG